MCPFHPCGLRFLAMVCHAKVVVCFSKHNVVYITCELNLMLHDSVQQFAPKRKQYPSDSYNIVHVGS